MGMVVYSVFMGTAGFIWSTVGVDVPKEWVLRVS